MSIMAWPNAIRHSKSADRHFKSAERHSSCAKWHAAPPLNTHAILHSWTFFFKIG